MTEPITEALWAIRLAVQGGDDDVDVTVTLACGSYPSARIEVTVAGATPEEAVAKLWSVLR